MNVCLLVAVSCLILLTGVNVDGLANWPHIVDHLPVLANRLFARGEFFKTRLCMLLMY